MKKLLSLQNIAYLSLLLGLCLFFYSFKTVFNGPHEHRQADSIFAGYYYCTDSTTEFLKPKIGPRGITDGVAINEFPIYAYVLGKICQIKGGWDEFTPKIISLLFAFVAGILFWLALTKKYNLDRKKAESSWPVFLMIFILLPTNWTFFSIPMPESTALVFYGISAYLWTHYKKNQKIFVLSSLVFFLAFLIRPYYILLLFLFVENLVACGIIGAVCVFLFWLWYRHWDTLVTTSPGHFGIRLETKQQMLDSIPSAIAVIPDRLVGHTAVVGFFSFYLLWKKQRKLILLYAAAFVMMYVLKPRNMSGHAYYLMNASMFASFIIFLSLPLIKQKQQKIFLLGFLLVTMALTQHNFHANGNWNRVQAALKEYGPLPEDALVATYLGQNTQWLYYLKRIGYQTNDAFTGQCPPKATHYMIASSSEKFEDGEPKLVIKDCPK